MKENPVDGIENAVRYRLGGVGVLLDYDVALFFNVDLESLRSVVRARMDHVPEDLVITLDSSLIAEVLEQADEGAREMMSMRPPVFAFTVSGAYAVSFFLDNPTAIDYTHMILESFGLVRRIAPMFAGLAARVETLEKSHSGHGRRLETVVRAIRKLERLSDAPEEQRVPREAEPGFLSARDRMELLRYEVIRVDRRRQRQQELLFFGVAVGFGVLMCAVALFLATGR